MKIGGKSAECEKESGVRSPESGVEDKDWGLRTPDVFRKRTGPDFCIALCGPEVANGGIPVPRSAKYKRESLEFSAHSA